MPQNYSRGYNQIHYNTEKSYFQIVDIRDLSQNKYKSGVKWINEDHRTSITSMTKDALSPGEKVHEIESQE